MDNIIMLLDGIASHIASYLLIAVVLKFLTKRFHMKKADMFLMKIHKPAAYGLVIFGAIHMFTSFYRFSSVGILPYIAGAVSLLAMIGAICTFRMRKTNKKWLNYHRVLTVIALVTCLVHPIL